MEKLIVFDSNIKQPEDKGILLKDIIENRLPSVASINGAALRNQVTNRGIEEQLNIRKDEKSNCVVGSYAEKLNRLCIQVGEADLNGKMKTAGLTTQRLELRTDDKTNSLTTVQKDNVIVQENTNNGYIEAESREPKVAIKEEFYKNRNSRIYTNKSPTLRSERSGLQTTTNGIMWRKLTPLECERLQTLTFNQQYVIISLCLDHLKNLVQFVENKCPKLLKLVLNAERSVSNEFVQFVEKHILKSQASTKNIVQKNVDTQTQKLTEKCTKTNQEEKFSNADIAGKKTMCNCRDIEEDSVMQSVFINIIEGKITHYGKEGLPQKEKNSTVPESGKNVLNLYGKEIMQLAESAEINLTTPKKLTTYTTLFRLHQKSTEQMLATLYWCAKNAIIGFIPKKTYPKCISLQFLIEDGYTAHASNSQRYKMLGNGWTVDVICHILKHIPLSDF